MKTSSFYRTRELSPIFKVFNKYLTGDNLLLSVGPVLQVYERSPLFWITRILRAAYDLPVGPLEPDRLKILRRRRPRPLFESPCGRGGFGIRAGGSEQVGQRDTLLRR